MASRVTLRLLLLACVTVGASCAATRPATPGSPAGDDITLPPLPAPVTLPYDPAYPRIVLAIESLRLSTPKQKASADRRRVGWGPWGWSVPKPLTPDDADLAVPPEPDVSLASALTVDLGRAVANIGNVQLVELDAVPAPARQRDPRLAGPYVLTGEIREFNEQVETTHLATGSVLGTAGLAMSIAGAVIGDPILNWTGVGVSLLSPAFDWRKTRRTGIVDLELQLYDVRQEMIVATIPIRGVAAEVSGLNGFALFAFGQPAPGFSLSLLGHAHRDAFNSVTTDIWERLKPIL